MWTHGFSTNPWGVLHGLIPVQPHRCFSIVSPRSVDQSLWNTLKCRILVGWTSISTIASCLGVNRRGAEPRFLWTMEDRANSAAGRITWCSRRPMGTAKRGLIEAQYLPFTPELCSNLGNPSIFAGSTRLLMLKSPVLNSFDGENRLDPMFLG